MDSLRIDGAWMLEPKLFPDERGNFHEWFKAPEFAGTIGHDFRMAQANCSISVRGAIRGIHYADVPPSQAKHIKCVRGAILDIIVDIRVGSPTFGRWESVRLDDQTHRAVYIAEGLGHAFMALTDDATVVYLCSEAYAPAREHGIHPLDPQLAIDWPADIEPLLSPKDAAAPTLAEAYERDLLPSYQDCTAFYAKLCGPTGNAYR
jgi:dTDP-4-dehydrorhamnose 3,5-epimerase